MSQVCTPSGWSAVARDFSHYCRVHGAHKLLERVALPVRAPAFGALAVYRFGRAASTVRSSALRLPLKVAYALASHVAMRLTKVSLPLSAELGEDVWLGSGGPLIIAPRTQVGPGSVLHAGTTLGISGSGARRGVPRLGARVTLCPGALVVGRVDVGDGAVVGPNSVVTRSVGGEGWLGVPAAPFEQAQALVPEVGGGP